MTKPYAEEVKRPKRVVEMEMMSDQRIVQYEVLRGDF